MPEPYVYATRMNPDGSETRYGSRSAYVRGRRQSTATAAATRARINRTVGGSLI